MRVPIAAPILTGTGPKTAAKKVEMTTVGLNWPKPQGEDMYAVAQQISYGELTGISV